MRGIEDSGVVSLGILVGAGADSLLVCDIVLFCIAVLLGCIVCVFISNVQSLYIYVWVGRRREGRSDIATLLFCWLCGLQSEWGRD